MKVVVGSNLRAEVRMKSGHSVWAKYREASEVIDLHGLFIDYWGSNHHEFTVLSQLLSPPHRIYLIRRTEAVVIGKYSGHLEVRFSANDTVRTFATAYLRRRIILMLQG